MACPSIPQAWGRFLNRTLILQRLSVARLPGDTGAWLKAVLLAMLAVQSAKLLWVLVTPAGPLGDWRPTAPAILSSEAQASLIATLNPFDRANAPAAGALATLPSDLKLFGVRDTIGSLEGGAIIGLPDGTQLSVSVGETIMEGVTLSATGYDYADVERGGAIQRLFLDQDKPPETLAAGGTAATPAAQGAAPSGALTAQALRGAISFAPRQANGSINGIVVAPGADAASFARTGLRAGDVIVAVGGATITSVTDLAQLQASLVPGASLSLIVERGGQPMNITLTLAGS